VYGPAWMLPMAGITGLWGKSTVGALLMTKFVSVVAHWATASLVYGVARRLHPEKAVFAFVAYAWNPLVLVHFAVDGHNDSLLLLFLMVSLFFGLQRRWEASFLALAMSALIKFVPLVLFPFFIWRARREGDNVGPAIGLALAFVLLFFVPFWAGSATF